MNDSVDPDVLWMRKAIREARKGNGRVSPNPMVGACIVKDGQLLSTGYHHACGQAHAEINAIQALNQPSDAIGATLYVTLEPCSTFGRTPPCCDAIVQHRFARVVVGVPDANPKHAGRAFTILKQAGISVRCGVEEKECGMMNRAFFKWIRTGRPFVTLKMAETLDGKIATGTGDSKWITGTSARARVARLRFAADAVMVGAGTFTTDAPSLTARDARGRMLKTPRRFVATSHPDRIALPDESWSAVNLPDAAAWQTFLDRLGAENVVNFLLEGGGELAASALRAGVVDTVEFHIAPKLLGGRDSHTAVDGPRIERLADAIALYHMNTRKSGLDLIVSADLHETMEYLPCLPD